MEKRRPTSSLSLFTTLSESFSSPNPAKSPRSFENGVFGLGIVAAMTDLSDRSSPIPIVSCGKATANCRGVLNLERENDIDKVDELDDESYTCVISHDVGNNLIKKRVYYFGGDKVNDCCGVFDDSPMMNVVCQVKREFWTEDFLTSCHHCNKLLHGLDIFMYRGEKAFCSSECRDNQIRSDDHKEKCGSGGRKPLNYSISPCSGPLVFFTGVVAA